MSRRDRRLCFLVSTIFAVAMAFGSLNSRAQGLPFEIEKFTPSEANTVIVPHDPNVISGDRPLGELSEIVGHLPEAVWTNASRNIMRKEGFNHTIGTERPDEEGPGSFIEVHEIIRDDAAWLMLKFHEVDLGDARLTISSPISGRSQTFTSDQLKEWGWRSSLFSGDRLRVQLEVAEESTAPRPVDHLIDQVIKGTSLVPEKPYPEEDPSQIPEQQAANDEEAPCGVDTRKPSQGWFVGRMRPAMCTVFILEGGVYATAGHCFRKNRELQRVEFNVPSSSESGYPQESREEDVYPVIVDSIICSDCVSGQNLKHGKDWAVFLLGKNTKTTLDPVEAQGNGFKILPNPIVDGESVSHVSIRGYGWDDDPLDAMYAQQKATDRLMNSAPTGPEDVELKHMVDTENGNSGSPMIAVHKSGIDTAFVVGIHTGGRCNPATNVPNRGTGFAHQTLMNAIATLKDRSIDE